jgi:hypothetical protein
VVVVDFRTDWAMDESWRGQRSWLSLRSSWVKSLSAELTLPGRANHGCEAWRVTGQWPPVLPRFCERKRKRSTRAGE